MVRCERDVLPVAVFAVLVITPAVPIACQRERAAVLRFERFQPLRMPRSVRGGTGKPGPASLAIATSGGGCDEGYFVKSGHKTIYTCLDIIRPEPIE